MRGTETVPHIRTIAKMTIGAIPEGTFLAQKMHFFAKFLRISRELYADNACRQIRTQRLFERYGLFTNSGLKYRRN